MSKKNKQAKVIKGQNRELANSNAKTFQTFLQALGFKVSLNEYSPVWYNPEGMPQTVTQVILENYKDNEGEPISFNFSHDTGTVMTDEDFN